MEIKILWTGCPNCKILGYNVNLALEKIWIEANITKITEMEQIMEYNIMSLPWFVINDKVVSYGKVLDVDSIVDLIKQNSN